MTKRCLDEGILQAYLDGELSHERAAEAASHLAACDACAAALAEAEEASSLFAAAFAPDESVAVPTEVLRSRIGAAVAQLEAPDGSHQTRRRGRSFGNLFAPLAGLFSFTPRGAAAFASLLAVVALALVYFSAQRPRQEPAQSQGVQPQVAQAVPGPASAPAVPRAPEASAPTAPAPPPEAATKGTVPVRLNKTRRGAGAGGVRPPATHAPEEVALPGEKDYRTAIASLEKTIKLGGDESLRPALRAEYERNLAILDSAINQTRQVAARNPKDEDAVGFLMAAYQSKVELLSKVADQAQVAALGR
jgi:anti-sigma factor RsiW